MYDEFKNGSIISLQLHNFQTYSDIKFDFHPKLNFIAGPNGSGKSTIANAIAFIFGGTTRILNKSKNLMDFIKFNTNDSFIEVKIKKKDKILTIRRSLMSYKNSSLWFLNGVSTPFVKIQQIYVKLKININNICNYLPQEKVAEFTRFSPEDLFNTFVETYHDKEMVEKINSLIDLEGLQDRLLNDLEKILFNKRAVETVISHMSRDVQKIKEKEEAEKRVMLMKSKKRWLIYESEKKDYLSLKGSITSLKTDIQKAKDVIEDCSKRIANASHRKEVKEYEAKLGDIRKSNAFFETFDTKIENLLHDKEKVKVDQKSNEKKKNKTLEKIDALGIEKINNIEKLENFKLPEKPRISTGDGFDKSEIEIIELKRVLNHFRKEGTEILKEVEELTRKKNVIVDIELRRLEQLKNYHRDTHKAVMWLRSNKDRFRDEIIEPCMLSISLKNSNYIAEAEGLLSFQALTSFICKNSRDFELLMKILKDEKKLAINAVEYNFRPKHTLYSHEEIRSAGFDGYIIDYIEDRPEILEFLRSIVDLGNIPVSKKDLDEVKIFKNYNFSKMAIRNKYVGIKRSAYNHKDFVIFENRFSKINLFNKSTSQDELADLEKKLKQMEDKRESNQKVYREKFEKLESLKGNFLKLQAKRDQERMKLYEYERKVELKNRLINEIKNLEKELEEVKDMRQFDTVESKLVALTDSIDKSIESEFVSLKDFVSDDEEVFLKILTDLSEIQKKMNDVTKEINDFRITIEIKKHKIGDLSAEKLGYEKEKEGKKKRIGQLKSELVRYSAEEMVIINKLPEGLESLEKAIASELAKITFLNTDKKILKDYKEKEKLLNDFHLKEIEIENKKKISNQDINNIKDDLIIGLSTKVEVINRNFENFFKKLGFEGEIRLQTEDLKVSKWQLNIMVKFRKEGEMQQLCSYFQSGGERSVSTIVFLLSLLESTPAPFRLVDEINQGMDSYNEKLVHNILVDLIKNEEAPQFFIITPKLVEELTFNDSMRVFVLYAGSFGRMNNKFDDYKTALLQ